MKPKAPPLTPLDTATLLFVVAILMGVVAPGWASLSTRMHASEQLQACEQNLGDIADAIRRFTVVKKGRLPRDLEDLAPKWLKEIPRCPANDRAQENATAGREDYGYKVDAHRAYTVYCRGLRHEEAGMQRNEPHVAR